MPPCKIKLKSIFTANGGGCGCGPKATDIIEPIPRPKTSFPDQRPTHSPPSSSATHGGRESTAAGNEGRALASLSIDAARYCCPENEHRGDHAARCSKTVSAAACPKIHRSLAVVKDSDDPYRDFRRSMLQMILEREIYSRNELQQLLDCFLQLNSPLHHETIVRAFMEIWNGDAAAPVTPVDSSVDAVGAGGGDRVKTLNSQVG